MAKKKTDGAEPAPAAATGHMLRAPAEVLLAEELEALRLVAPLLSEEKENAAEAAKNALPTAVNGPQAPRISVPASPSMPAPQPVRAAGWDDTAKRWP